MNMKLTKFVLSTILVFCLMIGLSSATALAEMTKPELQGNAIYGNGFPLLIVDGTVEDTTTVYWDKGSIGVVDNEDVVVVENADLSWATVYGGADTEDTGSTKITMTGGYVSLIYGGGSSDGDIEGDTDITIIGGTIDSHLYGGSNGGDVSGNTKLTITGGDVRGEVYGGSYYGYIEGSTEINISANISQNVVYGGGNNGDVWGNTNINIADGPVIIDIYGGGANGGYVYGERNLTVSGTSNIGGGSVGAGNGIRINSASVTNGFDSFAIGTEGLTEDALIIVVLPWDFDRGVNGDAVVTNAKDTYIDNNNTGIIQFSSIGKPEAEVDTDGNLTVKVEPIRYDPEVIGNAIYGNGSPLLIVAGTGENTTVYHDENDNGMIDGEDAVVDSLTNNADLSEYTIYGGAADNNDGDVELSGTKITMTGGSVETIVGGGLNSRISGNTEVIIKNGNITTIYGGGMDEAPDDPDNDIFGNIGGNTNIIVEGGIISTIYGGSKNGDIGDNTNITVKGGTILNIYGGCNKGDIVGKAITTISGGDISTVSAGGSDINDVIAIAILAIKGNAMVSGIEYFDELHVSDNIQIGLPDSGITIPTGSNLYIEGSLGNIARIYMALSDDAKLRDIIAINANDSDISKLTLLNNPQGFILKLNYNHLILGIYSPPIDKGDNEESQNNLLTEDSGLGENTVTEELSKTELEDKVDDLLEQNKTDLQIKVDTPKDTEKVEITLDPEGLEDLAKQENSSLTLESDLGNIAFDNEGLQQLTTNSGNSFTVSMTKVDPEELNDEQKAAAKDSEILNVNVSNSDGSAFELKDGASVNITLPHPLKEGETGSNLLGFVLNEEGVAIPQKTVYSDEEQTVSFNVNNGDTFFVQSAANGWLSAGNDWYYMENGLASGWQSINGKQYFFAEDSGLMITNAWQEKGGKLHFLGLNGEMVTGWQYLENSWYYFNEDGAMATGTTIDGHDLGEDGKLISSNA